MQTLFQLYRNAFGGLSKGAWMLAVVILINRSGTMVIPFLSIYLTSSLGFSLVETGWIMSMFGLGAIGGSFLGGWLTDRIGHFKVQFISLVGGGSMFFLLARVESFLPLAALIFFVSLVTEMLRPANAASVAFYAKPENVTRAFSLNRMAINLGFSLGPVLGGLLAAISYQWLFIADGITCISAGLVFFLYFRNKQGNEPREVHKTEPVAERKAWQDVHYLWFVGLVICFAMLFFQIFSTWPLYHRQVFSLSEPEIGFLLGLNGVIVFLFEMILVYKIGERISIRKLLVFGTSLNALAFFLLAFFPDKPALYAAVVVISFAEIFAMPFMATYTVQRSGKKNRGAYMGLYSVAYSAAFVLAPLIGTNVIASLGFQTWWLIGGVFGLITSGGFYLLLRKPVPQLEAV